MGASEARWIADAKRAQMVEGLALGDTDDVTATASSAAAATGDDTGNDDDDLADLEAYLSTLG